MTPPPIVWTGEYEIFEFDLGSTFNYAEMAALIAPRPFMVERGHFDGVGSDEDVAFVAVMNDRMEILVSNRMNEVMKVLTIMATIFIPLTFIAGIYGMNFKNMPELDFKFGYPIVIGINIMIAVVMIIFFKRKKWF